MNRARSIIGAVIGLALLQRPAFAGNGTIDVSAKTMDLSVLFTYSESDDNLDGASATTWKKVFNEGSRRLWNATNGQLRLGTITAYVRALDKKDDADVWILKTGDTAYTTDAGTLGLPGQHMTFNATNHRSLSGTYLADCSIAHEVGHYVFGLYDEYIGYVVPFAKRANYTESDGVKLDDPFPDVFYSVSTDSPVASLMDAGGGVPIKNLRTEFDTRSNVNKGVEEGQDFGVTAQFFKNHESCWETMSKLTVNGVKLFTDFPTGDSPNIPPPGFTDVVFKKIPSLSRLVLCIDHSASMAEESKLALAIAGGKIFTNLTQEAHQFVEYNKDGLREGFVNVAGDQLGAVTFNDGAVVLHQLAEVDAAGMVKKDTQAAIGSLTAGGHTAIGDGLQLALDTITGVGEKSSQEAIILISDGFDDSSTVTPIDAAAACAVRGVKVFSIALGSGADTSTLGGLAVLTGGKFYQATDALGLLAIYPSILAELRGGALSESSSNIAHEEENTKNTVTVDPFSEENTFSISNVVPGFTFAIKSPKGKLYTGSVPADGVLYEQSPDEAHYRVSNPLPGKWQQLVTGPPGAPGVNFSYALTHTSATQKVNVSVSTPETAYNAPDPIVFQCTVTAGDPVGGCSVKGVVTGPEGFLYYVTLYDDGRTEHGDQTANDGVYSCTFDPPAGSGVYSIEVTAINKNGKQAIALPELSLVRYVPKAIAPFQRTASAAVRATGYTAVRRDALRVDALTIRKNKNDLGFGTVTMTAEINAPDGQLDVMHHFMNVYLGTRFFSITPGALTETKTPGVFKLSNKDYQLSGTLKLGIGGSSRGRLVVTKGNFDLTGTPFADTVEVAIVCGNFQPKVTLQPALTPTEEPTKLTYVSRKNFMETPTLYFDGIKANVNHAATNKDTLRIVSTFQGGGQDYDPATQDADFALGHFALHIPKGALKKNSKQVASGKLAIGAGSAQLTLDLSKHTLVLNATRLTLNGELDRTMITALDVGTFAQTGVLTVKQTIKGPNEALTY